MELSEAASFAGQPILCKQWVDDAFLIQNETNDIPDLIK